MQKSFTEMETNIVLLIVLSLWSLGLTVVLVWFIWLLKNLLKDSKEKDFLKSFKKIQDIQLTNSKDIKSLEVSLNSLKADVLGHVQKIGLSKYNPFSETGGDHSFSLTLLDGKKNGIIITSLHTREATRVYTKSVMAGKSSIELSREETLSLNQALKN